MKSKRQFSRQAAVAETKAERESPTSVKLGDLRERADSVAAKLGSDRSAIIRLALICVLPQIESGMLRVPVTTREGTGRAA